MQLMGSAGLVFFLIIGIFAVIISGYDQQIGGAFGSFFATIRNVLNNMGINLPNASHIDINNQDFIVSIKNLMSQFKSGGAK